MAYCGYQLPPALAAGGAGVLQQIQNNLLALQGLPAAVLALQGLPAAVKALQAAVQQLEDRMSDMYARSANKYDQQSNAGGGVITRLRLDSQGSPRIIIIIM